ncbi:rho GTPase-activating protein 20-like isoform X1 [Hoplias malabaricus]|uniref:rho GTPase-activating protein 20-like isoform X1 n=2 Tax=Hoplias malabaricus TaxID=27720 RepID=UPI0034626954
MKLFRQSGSTDQQAKLTKVKPFSQRRLSAPSLLLSKALTRTKASTASTECVFDISPTSCDLVQSLLGPRRKLVCHGNVRLQAGLQKQERYLFLFNDIFIISKAKSCTQVKQKVCVRVCEMWTASCLDEVCEGTTNPERSFVIGWPTYNCVATFSTSYQKERWLALLESCIQEEKEHDDPKTIPLKIYAKDTGNCAYTKALSVRNSDSTSDVISSAIQHFGLQGSVKDFQLWVNSGEDEAPYPLIGHEFLYSIQMSYIRSLQQGEPLLHQQLAPLSEESHYQFILRPRKINTNHILPNEQKNKRKMSLPTWPFRRSSTVELNGQLQSSLFSDSAPDSTPGCLFGKPLSDVIVDNNLPPVIKEMLVCLCNEGAVTCGIFRRSAGVKACRELRRKLDTGEHHSLTEESVFVTAGVFKEFLRNIPGSLLCEGLYDQWIKAMELNGERGEENIVQEVQRLVQLLPKENLLLLRHVIAMLHFIQSHADHNQMTSTNLAVCISPSLLWSNTSVSLHEDTKRVCDLVRFLIDNCRSVFGEDIMSLLDLPMNNRGNLGSVGSLRYVPDSCYDSLDYELNTEPQDTPSTHLLKENSLSQDSLTSLSDGDLDQSELEAEPDVPRPLARIRTFTPAVRQSRPQKIRRCSEPSLVGDGPSNLDVRKASFDSSTMRDEDVFLEHGFENLRLTYRGGGIIHQRKLYQGNRRMDTSGSSWSSSATSSSSVSSMDISSDSVFSQSGDQPGPCPDAFASPQGLFAKREPEEHLQKNFQELTKGNLSQESSSTHVNEGCVKHLSCRASKPPSYQEALQYLNKCSPQLTPENRLINSFPTQTTSTLLFQEGKSLFYRGPTQYPTLEASNPSNPQAPNSNNFMAHIRSTNGTSNPDPHTDNEVILPQSVFFGQSCRLTMQKSSLRSQGIIPGIPDPFPGKAKGLDSRHSSRHNGQNCFIKSVSNRLGVVRKLEDVVERLEQGSGQWVEELEHGFHKEESYV